MGLDTTPIGVSVVEQLQLVALQFAVIALHAHPQSFFQGELVVGMPLSEHEQLIASQVTVRLTPEKLAPEASSTL
jgi:hypothetical protein